MLEKSTCRSETVYWWKLVVEAANWSPFFPPCKNNVYNYFVFSHKEFRTWGKCCFTWSIVQKCRLCWYLWFYTFVDLLPIMYKLSKKKIWRWIVFKYCGGFLCVFIKPKIWFIWWRKCLNRWNLFLFSPHILWECFVFFSIFNMKTTCYNTNDHYNCNVVDFHWVFNSFLNLVVWFFSLYTIFLKNDCLSQFCCILFIGYSCHGVCQVKKKKFIQCCLRRMWLYKRLKQTCCAVMVAFSRLKKKLKYPCFRGWNPEANYN